jgi:hypothetical protein
MGHNGSRGLDVQRRQKWWMLLVRHGAFLRSGHVSFTAMLGRPGASADPDWPGGVPCLELNPDNGACARRGAAAGRDARQCPQRRRAQLLGHSHEQSPLAGRIGGAHNDCLVYPKKLFHVSKATAMTTWFA